MLALAVSALERDGGEDWLAVLVAGTFEGYAGGAGLSGDFHHGVAEALGCAAFAPHHRTHHLAEDGSVFGRADGIAHIADVDGRVAAIGQPYGLDEARTHEFAVVGDGVVDGAGIERRHLGGVAENRARE